LWCAFSFKGVRQVMRWIDPGSFIMGSPEDEPERFDDEPQRHVNFSEGFWLAETSCTQELWEVVMGDNPSRFKSDQLPVERVNWHLVHDFLQQLNDQISGLSLTLPSEAQWEYACRAGTMTPFSFGETISTAQANYNGSYVYASGSKGEYREKTIPVKSFSPNAWGLHQMHGNVWEWCLDHYSDYQFHPAKRNRDTGLPAVSNPLQVQQSVDETAFRVVRGGCWFDGPGGLRSASRVGDRPGDADNFLGFRFARPAQP
jgi:formylglycine-generating enzyme required for sulfatase activity